MCGITDFKPRTNILKGEKGDLVTDSPPYFGSVVEPLLSPTQCTLH